MPEPIKTGKKLERRGDYGIHFVPVPDLGGSVNSDANRIIDTACEVLDEVMEHDPGLTAKQWKLRIALTTAGCVREVEVERFYHDGFGVVDRDDIDADKSYVTVAGMVAELNRLSRQAEAKGANNA